MRKTDAGARFVFLNEEDKTTLADACNTIDSWGEQKLTSAQHKAHSALIARLRDLERRGSEEYLSVAQAAAIAHVTTAWIRELCKRGAFGDLAHKFGTEWEIPRSRFDEWSRAQ